MLGFYISCKVFHPYTLLVGCLDSTLPLLTCSDVALPFGNCAFCTCPTHLCRVHISSVNMEISDTLQDVSSLSSSFTCLFTALPLLTCSGVTLYSGNCASHAHTTHLFRVHISPVDMNILNTLQDVSDLSMRHVYISYTLRLEVSLLHSLFTCSDETHLSSSVTSPTLFAIQNTC